MENKFTFDSLRVDITRKPVRTLDWESMYRFHFAVKNSLSRETGSVYQ